MRKQVTMMRTALLSVVLATAILLSGCDNSSGSKPSTSSGSTPVAANSTAPTQPASTSASAAPTPPKTILQNVVDSAPPAPAPLAEPAKPVRVAITTNAGRIVVELNAAKAPMTVANFLKYVDEGHYDKTIFHRVISDFMIQGGGFTVDMKEKATHPPIQNEATNGLKNDRGTLAMARLPQPHSATAQFFINVKDNAFLNHKSTNPREYGYCVFGKVIEGLDIVDKIKEVKTHTVEVDIDGQKADFENVPEEPVVIESIKRVE